MEKQDHSPRPNRTAAKRLIAVGVLWLLCGAAIALSVESFFPAGILWLAVGGLLLILGARSLGRDQKEPEKKAPIPAWDPYKARLWRGDEKEMAFYPQRVLELSAVLLEGEPAVQATTVAESPSNPDTPSNYSTVHKNVPEEMRSGLTPDALLAWARDVFPQNIREGIPWDQVKPSLEVTLWCDRVRLLNALKLPAALYLRPNPFEEALKNVGPDGLEDESGVACFLGVRAGTDAHEAIRAAADWSRGLAAQLEAANRLSVAQGAHSDLRRYQQYCEKRKVILTEDRNDLDLVTEEEKVQCRQGNITFAVVLPEGLYDLLEKKDVPLTWREWPGAADDAATYGAWRLHWDGE